jgi:hypothetical protein
MHNIVEKNIITSSASAGSRGESLVTYKPQKHLNITGYFYTLKYCRRDIYATN